ncbi:MAG: hypothetical protein PCFJNLEI_03314 [Verrucomicrobiae bacterium]|nr:hypothetical protein [Verrucomicrobiae bacterium]
MLVAAAESTQASNTNVFLVKSNLQGAGLSANGTQVATFKGDIALLLGTNTTGTTLAVAVHNVDCLGQDLRPTIRLVAYNRTLNQIVAPLIEFVELARILAAENKIVIQAKGVGLSGVEGADLNALITFTHVPCTSSNAPTTPLSVTIQPLGNVKPTGAPSFQAPITADDGAILFLTSDPNHPVLEVDVAGIATHPSPVCNIDLNTAVLNFGTLVVGSNSVKNVIIRNNGTLPCTVTSLTRNGSSAFAIGGPAVPFAVPANSSVSIPVTFTPTNGLDSAVLRVSSTDPVDPQQFVTLSGEGTTTTPCNINASPLVLNFGSVEVGTNKSLSVTVTNTGGLECEVDLLTLVTLSSNFTVNSPSVPFSVAPGVSEEITVTYTPTAAGAENGTLQIDNNDSDNRLILVGLNATGVAPACRLVVDQNSLDFGAVIIGTNRTLTVGITNTSLITCSITTNAFAGSAEFTLDPPIATPFDILPGDSATFVFSYTPTTNGAATGSVTINSTGPASVINFTGVGVAVSPDCSFAFSRSAIDFGDIAVGTAEVQKFQISNTSLSNCTIQSITRFGSADFTTISPTLPIQLGGGQTVEIGVRYLPASAGGDNGFLQVITDDLLQPIFDIPLDGNGAQCFLQVSTNSLDFGALPVGELTTLNVLVTNTNTVNCIINTITKSGSGDFALDPIVPTTRFVLQPAESVEVAVSYIPSNQGNDSGTVAINGSQFGSPTEIQLTGVGLLANLALSPNTLAFGAIQLDTTNTLTVTVNNTGNTNSTVTAVELLGSSRYFVTDPLVPFDVGPNQPVTVTIDYLPVNIQTILLLGGTVKSSGNPTIVTP